MEADATDVEALEQLGATEFGTAVVGVATSLEASVLITGNLVDLETPQIWAKAISRAHGRILRRIGAHHVVYPASIAAIFFFIYFLTAFKAFSIASVNSARSRLPMMISLTEDAIIFPFLSTNIVVGQAERLSNIGFNVSLY